MEPQISPKISITSPGNLKTTPLADDDILGGHEPGAEELKPRQYAEAVDEFSRLPTGAGQNFERLARFLITSPSPAPVTIDYTPNLPEDAFLVLYRLLHNGDPFVQKSPPSKAGKRSDSSKVDKAEKYFVTPQEFVDVLPPDEGSAESQIIFLRGHPTAEWLNLLGSKYRVDPEYFRQHLDFESQRSRSSNFSTPSLPSSLWHLFSLPIMTNGTVDTVRSHIKQDDIDRLRRHGDDALMEHHQKLLTREHEIRLGDSMIRQFHTFDEIHFAMEQRISVCMQSKGTNFVVFIWLDSAKPLDNRTPGPWPSSSSSPLPTLLTKSRGLHFLPIIRHKPMMALKSHLMSPQIIKASRKTNRNAAQTTALLHIDYGRTLHTHIMACDALYALNEILSIASAAEMQFLNLVDRKIDKFIKPDLKATDSLPNLKYIKDILFRHMQYLEEVLYALQTAEKRKWPKASGDARAKAIAAQTGVRLDYEHLQQRSRSLQARCTESIAVLMNSIAIAESKEAISQARRLSKLTFLAFIFVPLSFTTSFFGMNVRELQDPKELPIWAWFALSVPVTGFTVLLYFVNIPRLRRRKS